MKKLDFYEFAGILAPGIFVVYCLARLHPALLILFSDNKVGLGDLGLLFILGYIAGHLLQAIGNALEWSWWTLFDGMPSFWVRKEASKPAHLPKTAAIKHWIRCHIKPTVLSDTQRQVLPDRFKELLRITTPPEGMSSLSAEDWHPLVRQAYTVIRKSGRSERTDIFLGNYGLMRGVASATIVVIVAALLARIHHWQIYVGLSVMFVLSLFRMTRFGIHYARELFVQFISVRLDETVPKKKEEAE